ncbi:S41 family peptidase [uncultured Dokdonia sp.]|uniref:S41 family peptidase n=1 Tax=uncultured Dokdonia sp. TaxID=575653 RepID=UPI00260E492A|nr:S41 family peptidase [uncultured Dokdonia sp.]
MVKGRIRKKILWTSIIGVLLIVGYLATLSDSPLDDSLKFVDIDSYLSKKEMSKDIDSLISTFEKIHPNPYRFTEKSKFISKIDSIKWQLPDSLTTIGFWRIIDRVIIQYNDAHSYAEDSYVLTDYVKKEKLFFPYSAKIKNNKILISSGANSKQNLPLGTEIKSINGKTDEEIINALLTHATKETQFLKRHEISDDFGFYLWKTFNWDSEFKIHYEITNSNHLDSIVIKGINWEKRNKPITTDNDLFSFNFLEDNVGLMKITDFNGDEKEIEAFYKQSFELLKEKNASHLILDFRGHKGGADRYGEHLAKYFSKEPYRKLSKSYWKITPEFKDAFDRKFVPKSIRWFKPIYLVNEYSSIFYGSKPNEIITVNYEMNEPLAEEKRFNGDVYLITDHNTFSAGSIFAEMFKYYKMGKIIGQPTGNLCSFNGFALAHFTLPNSKLSFQVSSVYNIANNREESLKSVEPDYYIDLTNDPVKYILKNFIQ